MTRGICLPHFVTWEGYSPHPYHDCSVCDLCDISTKFILPKSSYSCSVYFTPGQRSESKCSFSNLNLFEEHKELYLVYRCWNWRSCNTLVIKVCWAGLFDAKKAINVRLCNHTQMGVGSACYSSWIDATLRVICLNIL